MNKKNILPKKRNFTNQKFGTNKSSYNNKSSFVENFFYFDLKKNS